MNYRLQIFSSKIKDAKLYSFAVDNFLSVAHATLCPYIKKYYQYPWQAYMDGSELIRKRSYHIDAIKNKKYAYEDYKDLKVTDVSAETMLSSHYKELLSMLQDKAEGSSGEKNDEAKTSYEEIKQIVNEILRIIEEFNKDEKGDTEKEGVAAKELRAVISKLSSLVHKHFPSYLQEDIQKMRESTGDQGVESPEGTEQQQLPAMPVNPLAQPTANHDAFIRISRNISNDLDEKEMQELLLSYAKKICGVLSYKHPEVIPSFDNNKIVFSDKDPILVVTINDHHFINNIVPCGNVSEIYPIYSLSFYQRYWKPIVEEIKQFYVDELKCVIFSATSSLPDMPKEVPYSDTVEGWDANSGSPVDIEVVFDGDPPSWMFRRSKNSKLRVTKKASTTPSKYTEQDYIQNGKPALVVCTDAKLESIYQKTGHVVQVIPLDTHVEVDIDFGNHIVRLEENQIEIIREI